MFSQKWTQHLTDTKDKNRFYADVLSSKHVLKRLADMVDEKLSSMDMKEMSLASYDNPNWAYRQAHQNGLRTFAEWTKSIVNLDQKETNNDPTQSIRQQAGPTASAG